MRAFTWMVLVVASATAWSVAGPMKAFWVALLIVALFFGDQATHLSQEAHRELAPTWIERSMQRHKLFYQIISLSLMCVGAWMLLS